MEMNIADLLQQFGFPAAISVLVLVQLRSSVDAMRTTIENNTKVMTAIAAKMGVSINDGK